MKIESEIWRVKFEISVELNGIRDSGKDLGGTLKLKLKFEFGVKSEN